MSFMTSVPRLTALLSAAVIALGTLGTSATTARADSDFGRVVAGAAALAILGAAINDSGRGQVRQHYAPQPPRFHRGPPPMMRHAAPPPRWNAGPRGYGPDRRFDRHAGPGRHGYSRPVYGGPGYGRDHGPRY